MPRYDLLEADEQLRFVVEQLRFVVDLGVHVVTKIFVRLS